MDWTDQIRAIRHEYKLKQGELAARLEVSQASVSQWERGVAIPSLRTRQRVQEMFPIQAQILERSLRASIRDALGFGVLYRFDGENWILDSVSQAVLDDIEIVRESDLGEVVGDRFGSATQRFLDSLLAKKFEAHDPETVTTYLTAKRDGQVFFVEVRATPVDLQAAGRFVSIYFRLVNADRTPIS